jgi:hypothetical protein
LASCTYVPTIYEYLSIAQQQIFNNLNHFFISTSVSADAAPQLYNMSVTGGVAQWTLYPPQKQKNQVRIPPGFSEKT